MPPLPHRRAQRRDSAGLGISSAHRRQRPPQNGGLVHEVRSAATISAISSSSPSRQAATTAEDAARRDASSPPKVWVDSDAGIDDAQALLCLAAAERGGEAEVAGVSCVAGNVSLTQGLRNLRRVRSALHAMWPIFAGFSTALDGQPRSSTAYFGVDGLGDVPRAWPHDCISSDDDPPPVESPSPQQCVAAEALVAAAERYPGALRMVALGPLTNIARALEVDAGLPSKLESLVIMGGTSRGEGNVTACAEYNWWYDPEAAASVLAAFPKVTVVPWETAMENAVRWEEVEEWHRGATSRTANFYRDILGMFLADPARDEAGWVGGDPLAMCCCLYPETVISAEDRAVTVECQGVHTRGACVVDKRPWSCTPKNASIVTAVDRAKFVTVMREALAIEYEPVRQTQISN